MGESGELEVSVAVMVVASVFERIHFEDPPGFGPVLIFV